ncbi:SusC/RagA family TonB-linked outer membrane protein [Bacteroides graminisolvens]|uniref:SusC/RagA family TonB-linked outer membrane protein n=1 Tax=Bacteroides graminisolvens TaxID=477666 RepID=UPI0023F42AC4|nr:TonB-dependent receptor [Bacteroides graminisolvens]MDD3210725.1 TonB-dependent receptor [Bacteroides graminisolvens]
MKNVIKKNQKISCLFVLMLFTSMSAWAQFQVKGTIVSGIDSEPMIGVAILENGTNNGAITDLTGNYSIQVRNSNATITVSFVGFKSQTIQVNGRNVININMEEDTKLIDEVVVVGYGVQKKSDITGAIASVNGDDIKNLSTVDAGAALQGKAAGIQVLNSSGAPGQGASIRIRGYSSNSDKLGPLLIVDGLKVDNIQYLDPSMIASMEVLKDAASAAIYGAQAGNGVVLITTKTGNSANGRPKITYSFKAINQKLGKTPEIFGAKDWIKYKELSGYDMKTLCQSNGVDYDNPQETDWVNEVFGDSWATQHSVTFQDGNDKGHFFTSVNYLNNDGIVRGKKDTYTRLTGQLNADYQLYKWIKVGTNTSIEKWATRNITHQSAYGSMLAPALLLDPLTPVYWDSVDDFTTDMKEQYATNPETILVAPNGKYYATSKFQKDDNGNPLLQRDRRNAKSSGFTVRGTAFADLTPIDGLVMTSRFSYIIAQTNNHDYAEPYYMNGQAKATDYTISASANNNHYYQWENFANFNKTLFEKHNIGAMIGMSYTEYRSDNVSASATGTGGNKILSGDANNFKYLDYVNSAETTTKSIGNLPGLSTSLSYFGRFLYTYDNRYSLQFNYRADAFDTSKLPSDKRWGKFPSVAVGWNIGNEKFITNNISSDLLSFLKFRASWGRNGNVSVLSNYPYVSPISYNSSWYQYGDDPAQHYGSYPSGLANPNLKWETSEQLDFGLDMRFFNDRLALSLDYFNKDTKDLLISTNPVPEVYVNTTIVNAGEINNRGFEFEASWKDHIGDLKYNISGNFSTLRNRVTYLYDDITRITGNKGGVDGTNNMVCSAFEEGHSIWYFRAYDYAGVNKETGAAQFRNHEGKIVSSSELSDQDMTDIGSAIPRFTYGLTINLEYKGLDFSVFGTGVGGNKIFNILYRADTPMRNSLKYYMDNAWSETNKNASMPAVANVAQDRYFWSSSASMFKGDYFKIKQIQLGYTLPKTLTKKIALKELRFFVSLDDFFTFSSYPGMDPETATTSNNGGGGYDIGTYPTMKKCTFGASFAF